MKAGQKETVGDEESNSVWRMIKCGGREVLKTGLSKILAKIGLLRTCPRLEKELRGTQLVWSRRESLFPYMVERSRKVHLGLA